MQKMLVSVIFIVLVNNVLCGHHYGELLSSNNNGGDNSNNGDHHKLVIHHHSSDNHRSYGYPSHHSGNSYHYIAPIKQYDDHHYEVLRPAETHHEYRPIETHHEYKPVESHHYDASNYNSHKLLGVHYAPVAHYDSQHHGYGKHHESGHGVSTVYHVRHRPQYTHGHYQQPSYGHHSYRPHY